jgi:DNA-binding NarL/FixJ family response regulator
LWPKIIFQSPPPFIPDQNLLAQFSKREQQLLVLLAKGYTNKEIAQVLHLSPNTIKTHLKSLFTKLQVSNRTQAAAEAKILNLIQ